MKAPTQIPTADRRSDLAAAVECLLERQFRLHQVISYIWPEQHRILFATADDQTGSVDVLVNWDVLPVAQKGADENYSAPAPTEAVRQP